jgi:TRAP-type C4-dicarboxylate transport system substrate-binding protein
VKQFVKMTVAVLVVAALVLGAVGCTTEATPTAAPAAPTTAPAGTQAPAEPTEAPAAAQPSDDEVIELKFHHHNPPQEYNVQHGFGLIPQHIEEATKGKVKITTYPAETLGKANTAVDMVINGIADMAWGYIGQFPGRFPITDLTSLPLVGTKSALQATKATMEMFKTSPEMQNEWKDVKVLFLHNISPHITTTTNKPIATFEDFKGLRIRAIPGAPLKYLEAIGATPVNVMMPEVFEALDKGTVDGACADFTGVGGFKWDDVCKYTLNEPLYANTFFMIMNKKKWDSLSPEIQQQIESVCGNTGAEFVSSVWDEANEIMKEQAVGKGMELNTFSEADHQKLLDAAPQVWEEYIKIVDDKGADGQALVNKIRELTKKYE